MDADAVDDLLFPKEEREPSCAHLQQDTAPLVERKKKDREVPVKLFWIEHCERAEAEGKPACSCRMLARLFADEAERMDATRRFAHECEGVHRGGITKAGNKHLRRALVEAAWHYLNARPGTKDLARGQTPDPAARRHATKGTRRLIARRESMTGRGVHKNKANVATARELACWVWAIDRMVEQGGL